MVNCLKLMGITAISCFVAASIGWICPCYLRLWHPLGFDPRICSWTFWVVCRLAIRILNQGRRCQELVDLDFMSSYRALVAFFGLARSSAQDFGIDGWPGGDHSPVGFITLKSYPIEYSFSLWYSDNSSSSDLNSSWSYDQIARRVVLLSDQPLARISKSSPWLWQCLEWCYNVFPPLYPNSLPIDFTQGENKPDSPSPGTVNRSTKVLLITNIKLRQCLNSWQEDL